jgi:hypothetical protein
MVHLRLIHMSLSSCSGEYASNTQFSGVSGPVILDDVSERMPTYNVQIAEDDYLATIMLIDAVVGDDGVTFTPV